MTEELKQLLEKYVDKYYPNSKSKYRSNITRCIKFFEENGITDPSDEDFEECKTDIIYNSRSDERTIQNTYIKRSKDFYEWLKTQANAQDKEEARNPIMIEDPKIEFEQTEKEVFTEGVNTQNVYTDSVDTQCVNTENEKDDRVFTEGVNTQNVYTHRVKIQGVKNRINFTLSAEKEFAFSAIVKMQGKTVSGVLNEMIDEYLNEHLLTAQKLIATFRDLQNT